MADKQDTLVTAALSDGKLYYLHTTTTTAPYILHGGNAAQTIDIEEDDKTVTIEDEERNLVFLWERPEIPQDQSLYKIVIEDVPGADGTQTSKVKVTREDLQKLIVGTGGGDQSVDFDLKSLDDGKSVASAKSSTSPVPKAEKRKCDEQSGNEQSQKKIAGPDNGNSSRTSSSRPSAWSHSPTLGWTQTPSHHNNGLEFSFYTGGPSWTTSGNRNASNGVIFQGISVSNSGGFVTVTSNDGSVATISGNGPGSITINSSGGCIAISNNGSVSAAGSHNQVPERRTIRRNETLNISGSGVTVVTSSGGHLIVSGCGNVTVNGYLQSVLITGTANVTVKGNVMSGVTENGAGTTIVHGNVLGGLNSTGAGTITIRGNVTGNILISGAGSVTIHGAHFCGNFQQYGVGKLQILRENRY